MSDKHSTSGNSVDLHSTTAPKGAAEAEGSGSAQAEPTSGDSQRPTARGQGWFGRDKRHSIAFYGDFYR